MHTARGWTAAGWLLLACSAAAVFDRYLIGYPGELWQLDLEVYRDGAVSLLTGRPLYDWLTGAPQFLPFTYPPFSALLLLPLALVPFVAAGWIWSLLQVVLIWWGAGVVFRPFLARLGVRAGLAQGAFAALLFQFAPVSDGVRFGQMNAVVVSLCLAEAGGALVGVAAAIKLTPAVFWLHYALARRWRELAASVGTAAAVTLLTAAAAPSASAVYWTDAMLDPARLGPNDGVSNQSIRGALLRIGPADPRLQTLLWVLAAGAVLAGGLMLSARLHRLGEPVAVIAAVGMVAVLVSPVSWIHHWHWGIAVVGALLGDARRPARIAAAAVVSVVLLLPLPWWGGAWPGHGPLVSLAGRVVQQSYTLLAVVALVLLWRLVASHRGRDAGRGGQGEQGEDAADHRPDPAHRGQPHPSQQ